LADAKRDANRIATLLGVSNADNITPLLILLDSVTSRLLVNSTITGNVSVVSGVTGIADGRKVVATAGSRETLVAATTSCKKVDIVAELDNTGVIVVGGSTVVAAAATRRGVPLEAGDSYSMEIDDLVDIYLDTTVNGDGVTFIYYT
jgi:hypothetical protein